MCYKRASRNLNVRNNEIHVRRNAIIAVLLDGEAANNPVRNIPVRQ